MQRGSQAGHRRRLRHPSHGDYCRGSRAPEQLTQRQGVQDERGGNGEGWNDGGGVRPGRQIGMIESEALQWPGRRKGAQDDRNDEIRYAEDVPNQSHPSAAWPAARQRYGCR
jgi:hypothetical protein